MCWSQIRLCPSVLYTRDFTLYVLRFSSFLNTLLWLVYIPRCTDDPVISCNMILGAGYDEIRSSYKRLALRWHPDKHNNSEESTKVGLSLHFAIIQFWDILMYSSYCLFNLLYQFLKKYCIRASIWMFNVDGFTVQCMCVYDVNPFNSIVYETIWSKYNSCRKFTFENFIGIPFVCSDSMH